MVTGVPVLSFACTRKESGRTRTSVNPAFLHIGHHLLPHAFFGGRSNRGWQPPSQAGLPPASSAPSLPSKAERPSLQEPRTCSCDLSFGLSCVDFGFRVAVEGLDLPHDPRGITGQGRSRCQPSLDGEALSARKAWWPSRTTRRATAPDFCVPLRRAVTACCGLVTAWLPTISSTSPGCKPAA